MAILRTVALIIRAIALGGSLYDYVNHLYAPATFLVLLCMALKQ